VVVQPCEVSWELVDLWFSVHGPFAAQGPKQEEDYPYDWMGGTGEVSSIKKRDLHRACGTTIQRR
jgi:hypothetical protein